MPELYGQYSEQIMETELLKGKYLSYFDYSRALNGPMTRKEVIGDSSVIKMQKAGEEDKNI